MTDKTTLANYLNQFSCRLELEIDFFIEQIKGNLDYLSAYNRYVNANEEYINSNPDKECDFFEFAYSQFHSYFPYIVNNSLLITFDSYLDNKFYILTEYISMQTTTTFNIKKSNGTYINKCFDYFNEVLKIPISRKNKNWVSIINKHQIRNLIVHNNSSLSKSLSDNISLEEIMEIKKHKDFELINSCEHIELMELSGKFYIKETEFLIEFLNDIKIFLKSIIEDVKNST